MKVMIPETKTEVRHFGEVLLTSKKKKTDVAIMAIVPIKNVNAT
jgi:hypothetical protein